MVVIKDGRKSKSDERQLVEKLTPLEDEALAIYYSKKVLVIKIC
jgi:hypothetical protein